MRFRFDWCILLLGLGGMLGCGSGRVDSPGFVRQGVQLTIAPDPVTRVVGENQQFSCGAFFNDGSSGDATNLVRWSSSNPAVASIDVKTGLASAIAPGNVTILAESDTLLSDSATMSVVFPSRLFVSNFGDSSIVVFDAAASGNAAPLRRIAGASTLLQSPALSSFSSGEFFVASFDSAAVRVFTDASDGNVAPLRSIAGGFTGFKQPTGATVIGNEVFVPDQEDQSVKAFPRNASGNVAPLRTIAGGKTELNIPIQVASSGNELLVTNYGLVKSVTVYPRTGSGNIAPNRTIGGDNTGFTDPIGLVVHEQEFFVCDRGSNSVRIFDVADSGNVFPKRVIRGANTLLSSPFGACILNGELYVVSQADALSQNDGRITVYPVNANGNVTPTRQISGVATLLAEPLGIVVGQAP